MLSAGQLNIFADIIKRIKDRKNFWERKRDNFTKGKY